VSDTAIIVAVIGFSTGIILAALRHYRGRR